MLDSLSSADELARLQGLRWPPSTRARRTGNDKDKGGSPSSDWSKKPPKGKWTEGSAAHATTARSWDYLGSTGTPSARTRRAKGQDQGMKQEGETGKGAMGGL